MILVSQRRPQVTEQEWRPRTRLLVRKPKRNGCGLQCTQIFVSSQRVLQFDWSRGDIMPANSINTQVSCAQCLRSLASYKVVGYSKQLSSSNSSTQCDTACNVQQQFKTSNSHEQTTTQMAAANTTPTKSNHLFLAISTAPRDICNPHCKHIFASSQRPTLHAAIPQALSSVCTQLHHNNHNNRTHFMNQCPNRLQHCFIVQALGPAYLLIVYM